MSREFFFLLSQIRIYFAQAGIGCFFQRKAPFFIIFVCIYVHMYIAKKKKTNKI